MSTFATHRPPSKGAHRGRGSRAFGASLHYWLSLRAAMFARYQPELHYMRGPGPKWRAKHALRRQTMPAAGA
jgi:hypothetical protein